MDFYLGTHMSNWLWEHGEHKFFVSHKTLRERKTLKRAKNRWALDSGAFSELSTFGMWTFGPKVYVDSVRRYRDEIGNLDWAAIQDWMCEPFILQLTGRTVDYHQKKTVESCLELRQLAPDINFIPVLQGFTMAEYFRHVEMYAEAGVNLGSEERVGLGSICRRQSTFEIAAIVQELKFSSLRLHAFGVKIGGLSLYGGNLSSADSMAWSFDARRKDALDECAHTNCANCFNYASRWYTKKIVPLLEDRCHLISV